MNKTAYNTRHNIVVLAVEATWGPKIVFLAAASCQLSSDEFKRSTRRGHDFCTLDMPCYAGSGRNITKVLYLKGKYQAGPTWAEIEENNLLGKNERSLD